MQLHGTFSQIHVPELVESLQFAVFTIMVQFVFAQKVIREIHSLVVIQIHEIKHIFLLDHLTHVSHHLVGLTVNVKFKMTKLFALAYPRMWALHPTADPSVSRVSNVLLIRPVQHNDVSIHASIVHVLQQHCAKFVIIHQFADAHLVTWGMPLLDATLSLLEWWKNLWQFEILATHRHVDHFQNVGQLELLILAHVCWGIMAALQVVDLNVQYPKSAPMKKLAFEIHVSILALVRAVGITFNVKFLITFQAATAKKVIMGTHSLVA